MSQKSQDWCSHYFRPKEICIQLKKENDVWKLNYQNDSLSNSFGCEYKTPKSETKSTELRKSATNNLILYNEIKFHSELVQQSLWPLGNPGFKFQIRHFGDPLLSALNMNADLNFGHKS